MKVVYETFEEFKTHFLQSKTLKQTNVIQVSGIEYKFHLNELATIQTLMNNKPFVAIYQPTLGSCIGLTWVLEGNSFVPKDIEMIPAYEHILEGSDNIVGSSAEVIFTQFSRNNPIRAKVDTGADVCSLHCTKWKTNNGKVSFVAPNISNNVITMNLHDQQAVKTADGGVEYRPVVEFDIVINGHDMSGIAFNLNNRSGMEFPILIGQNALQKGKFMVNPSATESFDWQGLETYFRSKE